MISRFFAKGYGQVEVGGPFVGAEFHKSRPIPSLFSFFYPIAYRSDLSPDYWLRGLSLPFHITHRTEQGDDDIGLTAWSYEYSPHTVCFHHHDAIVRYQFGQTLPFVAVTYRPDQRDIADGLEEIVVSLDLSLRTCHSDRWVQPDDPIRIEDDHFAIVYSDPGADNTVLFVSWDPASAKQPTLYQDSETDHTNLEITWSRGNSGTELEELNLQIGTCGVDELDSILDQVCNGWQADVELYNQTVENTVKRTLLKVDDPTLNATTDWAKAIQVANIHYLDGWQLPMPCPVEYNYFFTHDFLLTSFGVVNYDLDFVSHGLRFIYEKGGRENILPHAFYWRDGEYVTESCKPDDWNHLWFILLSASYLRHSEDTDLIAELRPMLDKSMDMILENLGPDNLMHGSRPDWWDIGNVYGPRSYLTSLAFRTLLEYSDLPGTEPEDARRFVALANWMKQALVNSLWNDNVEYLLNLLDGEEWDLHLYSGSLMAVIQGLLDQEKAKRLLETVKNNLLCPEVGVKNAVPMDFLDRAERYRYLRNQVGKPGFYFNGGVWPQGNFWYARALLATGQGKDAVDVLKSYCTLDGIAASPNGLSSFYEYRICLPDNQRHGEIDKPTFLWAGGMFLQTLYELAGVREDGAAIWITPEIPESLGTCCYNLTVGGRLKRIEIEGSGPFFRHIKADGQQRWSAVLDDQADRVRFIRGIPDQPYLAASNVTIDRVDFQKGQLTVNWRSKSGTDPEFTLMTPADTSIQLPEGYEMQSAQILKEQAVVNRVVGTSSNGAGELRVCFGNMRVQ